MIIRDAEVISAANHLINRGKACSPTDAGRVSIVGYEQRPKKIVLMISYRDAAVGRCNPAAVRKCARVCSVLVPSMRTASSSFGMVIWQAGQNIYEDELIEVR